MRHFSATFHNVSALFTLQNADPTPTFMLRMHGTLCWSRKLLNTSVSHLWSMENSLVWLWKLQYSNRLLKNAMQFQTSRYTGWDGCREHQLIGCQLLNCHLRAHNVQVMTMDNVNPSLTTLTCYYPFNYHLSARILHILTTDSSLTLTITPNKSQTISSCVHYFLLEINEAPSQVKCCDKRKWVFL